MNAIRRVLPRPSCSVLVQQRRWDSVMYRDLSSRIPTSKNRPGSIVRSALRDTDQKWDPDWQFRHMNVGTERLMKDLDENESSKRILTYKLERYDLT